VGRTRGFRSGPAWLILGLWAALLCVGCAKAPTRPNIVVIVLDTVRRDATGLAASNTPAALKVTGLMPRLDRLSRRSVTFTDAVAAAPWTVPSHASMFTGKLPAGHRCTNLHAWLDDDHPTFAGILDGAGYETAAFYSNPWLSDKTTFLLRGFARRQEADIGGMFELRSRDGDQGGARIVADIGAWLGRRDGDAPFLLFANFLESHLAYDPPRVYRERMLKDLPADDTVPIVWAHEFNARLHEAEAVDWSRVQRLYAGDVWTADRLLGEVLDLLAARGLAEDTVVIVTSDHGENLGDHELMDHQYSVHETLLAVPLVIHVPEAWRDRFDPGAAPGGSRDDPALLTDLFATVLDLAGLAPQTDLPFSRSWFGPPASPERPLVSEYAGPSSGLLGLLAEINPEADLSRLDRALATVRVGDLRLTVDGRGAAVLHDVARDPGQSRDLSAEHPGMAEALGEVIRASTAPGAAGEPEPVEIDEETRRRLESLGYVR